MKKAFLLLCALMIGGFSALAKPRFILSCSATNDLYRVLKQSGIASERTGSPEGAVARAVSGSAVLILADHYPAQPTVIPSHVWDEAERKRLKVFVEFADNVPGIKPIANEPRGVTWERGIVSANVFGPRLPKLSLLALHDCRFIPVEAGNPWVVIGRVAGFDTAVFGLPKEAHPILFEVPDRQLLVATTKLSDFITARYAPSDHWTAIWETILNHLSGSDTIRIKWSPIVAPAYSATERLPRNFERRALSAAANWIHKSRLLVPAARTNEIHTALAQNGEASPLPPASMPNGDGTHGILEGYASGVQPNGDQLQRLPLRADCNLESAAVLAFDYLLGKNRQSRRVAENLVDFVYFKSGMCAGQRADPSHGSYGLIAWGDISPAWLIGNYGDDNARSILATITAAAALGEDRWDDVVARALLANFRVTGKLGFQGDRINNPALDNGWEPFFNAETINYSPHFESGLWACNLWAYRATGYEGFLNRATNAIAMTMNVYPSGWRWKNHLERARMLLCLAWLVRVDDTPQHRQWLMTVANDLLQQQEPNGALRDWIDGTGGGHYKIPQSNEEYGTGETPLIQQNGDPASDQLYITGFALLGLREAVGATGDPNLKRAEDKLAEFLCRIQVRSRARPYLDGWWFRAFDDRRWEYWASSADLGWGAWSMEAGWAQAWTAVTLGLRAKKTTLWDFTKTVDIKDEFESWKPKMLGKQ